MPHHDYRNQSVPRGFRADAMPPPEFPHEYKEFHKHSSVSAVNVLRSTGKMILAGWLIDKLELKDPLRLAFGLASVCLLDGQNPLGDSVKKTSTKKVGDDVDVVLILVSGIYFRNANDAEQFHRRFFG
jgi:hypothetical protein